MGQAAGNLGSDVTRTSHTKFECVSSTTAIWFHQSTLMAQAANWQHSTVSTQVLSLFQISLLSRLMAWKLSLHNSCSILYKLLWHLCLPWVSLSCNSRRFCRKGDCITVSFKVAETVLHLPWAIQKTTAIKIKPRYFCQIIFLNKFTRSSICKITAEGCFNALHEIVGPM